VVLGRGTFAWVLVDEDNVLDDDDSDPVTLYGIGRVGKATRAHSVQLQPAGEGVEVLKSAVHAGGNMEVTGTITANGGPVSSNATLTVGLGSTVNGDVEATTIANAGTITGSQTTLSTPKDMPPANVFDTYLARATPINWIDIDFGGGKLQGKMLSHTRNPYGAPNPDGVYFVDVPSKAEFRIEGCRLEGTFVIRLDEKSSVRLKAGNICEPHRPDYPLMIIKAISLLDAEVELDCYNVLNEGAWSTNFNPPDWPYKGVSNSTTTDLHESKVRGLIHVIRDPFDPAATYVGGSNLMDVCVVADGYVLVKSTPIIRVPSSLYISPPDGYSAGSKMIPTPGTWRWAGLPIP